MRVYIASPFFNNDQLQSVIQLENLLAKLEIEFFSPRDFGVIQDMTPEEKEKRMKGVYEKNIIEIENSTMMICLIDDKDTGTTFELGYYAALKTHQNEDRKLITASFKNKPVNVMLRYCVDAHAVNIRDLEHMLINLKNKNAQFDPFESAPEVNE